MGQKAPFGRSFGCFRLAPIRRQSKSKTGLRFWGQQETCRQPAHLKRKAARRRLSEVSLQSDQELSFVRGSARLDIDCL